MENDNNTIELKVGDFVKLLGDQICEVLAVINIGERTALRNTYSLCYALKGHHAIRHYQTIKVGDVYGRLELELLGFTFEDSTSIPPSKYGDAYEVAERLLESACVGNGGYGTVTRFINTNMTGDDRDIGNNCAIVHSPEQDGKLISLYLNAKDRKRDRRTTMKVGRAFKHMLNNLDNTEIARLTEQWIEETSPRNFTIKVGGERKDFRRAYCGKRAAYRNPQTTSYRKSIASSCMHTVKVDTDDGTVAPAEVFATGDFKIAWLETDAGEIAGRVVFSCKEDKVGTHAPIYGACEQSLDMLAAHMTELGVDQGEDWGGLRLLNISGHGGTVAPYLDCGIEGHAGSDYITLGGCGDITFESTDGHTSEGISCEACGDSVSEQDMFSTDEGCLCEYCFNCNYVFLDCGEVCAIEDAVEARYHSDYNSSYNTQWVYLDDACYCEQLDEHWIADDVTFTEDGDECVPTHLIGDFPELFPNDDDDDEEEVAAA
tara:strand:- start:1079 stop:2542 length:1464 start_codon:yes stop_codon:yes gene_type:complete